MECNVGKLDRQIRIGGGAAVMLAGAMSSSFLLGIVGLAVFASGLYGFCYVYKLAKFSTNKN